MVELEWEADRRADVTFVAATVTNTRSTPQTVTLVNRLDGPTWPPRRNGLPVPEWNEDEWTAVVEPGRCRGVGFASPASVTSQPLEVVAVERASSTDRPVPALTLAELDDPAPIPDVFRRNP